MSPPRDHPTSRELLHRIAEALSLHPVQAVHLAYYEWHGRDPEPAALRRLAEQCASANAPPAWLRRLEREILAASTPLAPPHEPASPRPGLRLPQRLARALSVGG